MLFPIYNFPKQRFVRGEGAYLWDENGDKYLDFTAGIGVNSLGHCHPKLVAALAEQGGKVWHTSNLFSSGLQEEVAALLEAQFAPDSMAFFCNSGNEAVDSGIKLARRYWHQRGINKRRIICFERSFHGRGMATISASGQHKLTDGFAPLLPGFDHVPFGDLEAVKRAIRPDTAAILLEPIQGEGGVHIAADRFVKELRALCDDNEILLFLDEVQCGIVRSGEFFAHTRTGVKADIIALAKGLGGGFPVGCCLATAEVGKGFSAGSHGSTFGGNPLAMAVAREVLRVVAEPSFQVGVKKLGDYLLKRSQELVAARPKLFKNSRGRGLMVGVDCVGSAVKLVEVLRKNGLLLATASGNVLRFLPPLIITQSQIDEAMQTLEKVAE